MIFARRIFIDIYISMFMALTLLCFALAERYPSRRRLFLAMMYVAVGLATLTKGPMAIALPGLVFLLYLAAHREVRRVREMMLVPGILIVSAIVIPWYFALYQRDGWTHIASFVFGENLARFTDGVGVTADRGPLFYIPVILSDGFPWSLLLPVAAVWWVVDRRQAGGPNSPARRVQSLLWLWMLVIVVFFSLSEAKQDLYIFPIVPAVAALGGIALVRASSETLPSLARSTVRWAATLAGFVLLVIGAGVTYLFQGPDPVGAASAANLSGVPALGAIAICGGATAVTAALVGRVTAGLFFAACALVAANWLIVLRVLPDFEAYKPVPGLSRVLAQRAAPDDAIATYNVAVPSLVYYLRRHIDMSYDATPIVELLSSDRRAFVILPSRDYEAVRDQTRAQLCVVSTHATFDVKLRNVLARDPLPQLFLITNRCN
jgi:4-amino-4-deoxy-L-arabinose transferase-like glycosyltransferase